MKGASQLQKLVLIGLEADVDVTAQYNPKEVSIEKTLSWTPDANKKDDRPDLTFASVSARTLSMELMFDTYETPELDVQVYLAKLSLLASIIDPNATNHTEKDRRPTVVQVQWGRPDMPSFRGVIASLSTKLTMFHPDGRPCRATCSIKIMETTGIFRPDRKRPPAGPTYW